MHCFCIKKRMCCIIKLVNETSIALIAETSIALIAGLLACMLCPLAAQDLSVPGIYQTSFFLGFASAIAESEELSPECSCLRKSCWTTKHLAMLLLKLQSLIRVDPQSGMPALSAQSNTQLDKSVRLSCFELSCLRNLECKLHGDSQVHIDPHGSTFALALHSPF